MQRKILLTGAYPYSEEQIHRIENLGWEVSFVKDERQTLEVLPEEFEVVVCNGLFLYHDITKFKNLRLVQATSVGVERLPIAYMEKNHISYYNAKGVYSIPMAEWTVMSILEIYKNAYGFFEKQQQKRWEKDRSLLELTDKKVCIIGYGDVGKETAKRLVAFGTEITAVNRSEVKDEFLHQWVPLSRMEKSLREADILILSIAFTEETKNLLNEERLGLLKNDCTLVNVSRGAVLDEKALLRYLKQGKYIGVALDVFEEEPLPEHSELWKIPRVIVSPHNSFVGDKVNDRMFSVIYSNLEKLIGHEVL